VDESRRLATIAQLLRTLDKMENDSIPTASPSTNALEFGDVRYGTPVTRTLVLDNTGQVGKGPRGMLAGRGRRGISSQ